MVFGASKHAFKPLKRPLFSRYLFFIKHLQQPRHNKMLFDTPARGHYNLGNGRRKDETMSKDAAVPTNPAYEPKPHHSASGTRFGASLEFNGDLTGHESVLVEGKIKGTVTLPSGTLTISRGGRVDAEVKVKELILNGDFEGNVTAGDRVQLAETARMTGDISAARVSIAAGARFKGKIKITKA